MDKVLKRDFLEISSSGIDIHRFNDSSILITGATGLLGSLLVRFFLFADAINLLNIKVYALVRNKEKAERIFQHYDCNNLTYVVADLEKDNIELSEHIDFIIHAAAITKSKTMISNPVDVIKVALNGTEKILDLAVKDNAKVIYLSSMEVYGQPNLDRKIIESDLGKIDLYNPRSCYPESKRMCECMCTAYAHQYGLKVCIARLAQTFGAGILKTENRVFAQFARSIIRGENIVLHTEGKSEGNYVYTADAIKAILLLLVKGNSGEAYNVVNEISHTTIKNMAQTVIKNFGNKQQKVIIDIPKENMGYAPDVHMKLSGEKLEKLGWKPNIGLVEAYRRMINYMKN